MSTRREPLAMSRADQADIDHAINTLADVLDHVRGVDDDLSTAEVVENARAAMSDVRRALTRYLARSKHQEAGR